MELDLSGAPAQIASGTSMAIENFAPVFLLIGGVVLAITVLTAIQGFFIDWGEEQRDRQDRE